MLPLKTVPYPSKKIESDWAIPGGLAQIYYEEEGCRVSLTIEKEDGTGSIWQYACYYVEAEFLWNGTDTDSFFYTVYIQRGVVGAEHYALYTMNGAYEPAAGKLSAEGGLPPVHQERPRRIRFQGRRGNRGRFLLHAGKREAALRNGQRHRAGI